MMEGSGKHKLLKLELSHILVKYMIALQIYLG